MNQQTAEGTEQKLYDNLTWARRFGSADMQARAQRKYDRHLAQYPADEAW